MHFYFPVFLDMELEQLDVSMFGESSGMADVKLVVEGRSIPVNKAVLSIASPVFRAMFEGDFKEKGEPEISLTGKKVDDVLMLLKCIYPDSFLSMTEYQMGSLKTRCEDELLHSLRQKFDDFYMKDCACLYKYLTMAVKFNLERLETYCISLAADFKQQDRESARQIHDIPVDVVRKVEMLAISRLEIIREDADSVLEKVGKFEDKIRNLCQSTFHGYTYRLDDTATKESKDINNHFRALRLAYTFLKSNKDMKKLAVSTIRDDKRSKHWCHDEDYNLLSENIKRVVEDAI